MNTPSKVIGQKGELQKRKWFRSVTFLGLVGLILIPLWDMIGITFIMNTTGSDLVVAESARLMEETGNNAITRIERRSHQIEALARDIATLGETLPKQKQLFMTVIPKVLNFQGDPGVAGGGIWPEPFTFDPTKQRNSFFYGRNPNGELTYYDDYNQGIGYHEEEWYPVVKYSQPNRCFWSKAYTDPYSKQPMVTCSVAMKSNNRFVGVATVDLKLEGLHSFLQQIQKRTGGYLFLVDRGNRFITFPDPKLVQKKGVDVRGLRLSENMTVKEFSDQEPMFASLAIELENIRIKTIEDAEKENPALDSLAKSIDDDSTEIDSEEAKLISAVITDPLRNDLTNLLVKKEIEKDFHTKERSLAFIFNVPESYWKLIIIKPMSEAEAVASTINRVLLTMIALTILCGIVVAFLFLRHFVHLPLIKALAAIDRVNAIIKQNRNDAPASQREEPRSKNEFLALAQVMNTLAYELEDNYKAILDLNESLESKVDDRTKALEKTLAEIRALKLEQDGDYYLTAELLKPLAANAVKSDLVKVDFFVRQKKQFHFKKWKEEIGGDICIAHTISLRGQPFTVFVNADGMGKSIQGAAGALVLGSIIDANIERTKTVVLIQEQSPERWLKHAFVEMHRVFESFTGSMLVSLVMGLLDDEKGTLYYINADHPQMILYRNRIASFIPMQQRLLKMGMMRLTGKIRIETFKVEPGDVILVGSDGRDDIAIKDPSSGLVLMNEDETKVLEHVENSDASLDKLVNELQKFGQIMDDLSLMRLEYLASRKVPEGNGITHRRDIIRAIKNRDFVTAATLAARFLHQNPHDTDFLFQASRLFASMKHFEAAVDCAERLRLRKPDFIRNLRLLCRYCLQIGDTRRAASINEEIEALLKAHAAD